MRGAVLALPTSGAVIVCLTIAPATSAAGCRNLAFEKAAVAAIAQRTRAIGEAYVENYVSAKAEIFIGWRTMMNAPVPCNSQLRKARTHLVRHLGALWLSYTAMAAGDTFDGLALLVTAAKEAHLLPADLGREFREATDGGRSRKRSVRH
jgi:hypothetical protein